MASCLDLLILFLRLLCACYAVEVQLEGGLRLRLGYLDLRDGSEIDGLQIVIAYQGALERPR